MTFIRWIMLVCMTTLIANQATSVAVTASPTVNPGLAEEPKQESADSISYYRSVRPILQRRCSGCHFPGKREGKLSVVTVDDLLTGGESGAGYEPGAPDSSTLIAYISGEKPEMPLNAEPLSDAEVEIISNWIKGGAVDDTPASLGPQISADNPPRYQSPPVVTSVDYSPDGKWLAVSGYHEVLLHSTDDNAGVRRLIGRSPRIESLAFSPDGQLLAVAGGSPSLFGELQLWNVADGRLLHSTTVSHDTLFGVCFNNDGTLVSFGGADNSLRAVSVETGELVMQMDAHADWVQGSTFSLANDHLISVSRYRSMKLTIVANGQFVDNITSITPGALKGGLADVQRHPSKEEVLTVGADGEPRLYRIFRVQERRIGDDFNLIRGYSKLPGRLCDVDFSADGSHFVCGSSTAVAGAARIYDTEDAAKIIDLKDVTSPAFAVAFRPDGTQVAVAGFDGMVRLFDANTGTLQKSFSAAAGIDSSIPATAASN